MESEYIAGINIALSSKMEHNTTAGRGLVSTGVISTGNIPIHHICIGDNNGAGSGNSDDSENSIVSSSSSLYYGRTTKKTKEESFQQRVVCVKNKCGPEGSM